LKEKNGTVEEYDYNSEEVKLKGEGIQ